VRIILLVRWSFIRAGFRLDLENLFSPLTVNPQIVLERIAIPEIPIEEFATPETMTPQITMGGKLPRRHRIPRPHEFALSLQAQVDKAAGTCSLCDHVEEEDAFYEEETRRA
jgi:hypothetical protein